MIVDRYEGFIVIGQSQQDFRNKCSRIDQGDRKGFYTEEAYDLGLFTFRTVNNLIGAKLAATLWK